MKAERRHELAENELAKGIQQLPDFWKKHGNKVLLGIVLIALAFYGYMYYSSSAAAAKQAATKSLDEARDMLVNVQFGGLAVQRFPGPDAEQAKMYKTLADSRKQAVTNLETALRTVADSTSEGVLLAQAKAIRGEFSLEMSMLEDIPGADKNEGLRLPRSREAFASEARAAFEEVLRDHPDERRAVARARFGLAALEENARNWDSAKGHYEAIIADDTLSQAAKTLAKSKLNMLETVSKPIFTKSYQAPASTQPASTQPASTQPASTTQSATQPFATQPATQPSP